MKLPVFLQVRTMASQVSVQRSFLLESSPAVGAPELFVSDPVVLQRPRGRPRPRLRLRRCVRALVLPELSAQRERLPTDAAADALDVGVRQ